MYLCLLGRAGSPALLKEEKMAILIEDEAFLGTEKKYLIDIKSSGFNMETDDFDIEIKRGSKIINFKKEDLVKDLDGNFYIVFDTNDLGPGGVTITVVAHVPDEDFQDGFRDEVDKFKFLKIKSH